MTATFKIVAFSAFAVLAVAIGLVFLALNQPKTVEGSTARGSEYQGTTTAPVSFAAENLLQTGGGTLGSVVITGANTGQIWIYDATTSNVSLRTGQPASSTLLLAEIPASAAAGTYTFDRVFFTGLYVSVIGNMPTTTITFRQ